MTRREIEDLIEQAIAALDALDGDPDREADGDDEPDGSDELNMQPPHSYRAA